MENNYQKALDNIKTIIDITNADNITRFNKLNVDILQELIDNYDKLENLFNLKCEDGEKIIKELTDKIKILEKALLLACKNISFKEDYEEPESQEEAQAISIYRNCARPKELMKRYIDRAKGVK